MTDNELVLAEQCEDHAEVLRAFPDYNEVEGRVLPKGSRKLDRAAGMLDEAAARLRANVAVGEEILVPREPSGHMLSDGAFQIFRGERITEDDLDSARRVWRAMTKAALAAKAKSWGKGNWDG